MELIKKNIHMDRVKCSASTQVTMEEDVNISDQKADAFRIITQKGRIVVEEVRPVSDNVVVKGKLCYSILYLTDENEKRPSNIEGTLPFEEKVHMDGVAQSDNVMVKTQLEDLSVGLINSRKMSVRNLFSLELGVEELYDEEAVVEIANSGPVEILKKPMDVTILSVDTKDIYRIKEEIEIPAGMPNMFELIWKDVKVNGLEFRLLDGKIAVQGELSGFFLYIGEGEDSPIRYYEVNRAFSGSMDVSGCREDMIPDISYEIEHEDVEIRPDFDGEERILGMDIALNISIKLMETQTVQVITDVYGILQDIEPVLKEGNCKSLLTKNTGKVKITDMIRVEDKNPKVLQLCHVDGSLYVESQEIVENGIEVSGVLMIKALYVTGDDEIPYACLNGSIPFDYVIDIQGICPDAAFQIKASIEQLSAVMTDGEEMDVKAVLSFDAIAYDGAREPMVSEIAVSEVNTDKRGELPSMVIYIAKENDNIWNVGKKYYVPMKSIREVNHLTKDELSAGDKILVVKEIQ